MPDTSTQHAKLAQAALVFPPMSAATLAWAAWLLAFAIASALYPKDASFDVVHYHVYNGWAALNGRTFTDLAPAEMHAFLNPTWQAGSYWLMQRLPGVVVAAILSIPQGLILPALYALARRALPDIRAGAALALAGLGFSAASQFGLFASMRNDTLGALAFVFATTLVLADRTRVPGWRTLAVASFVMGLAAGIKLTNIPYLVGYAAAALASILSGYHQQGWRRAAQAVGACAVAGALGLFLGGAGWAYVLWRETGNPVFPMMNGLFHSPLAAPESFRDERYLPETLWEGIVRPFLFLTNGKLISEEDFFDPRLLMGYLSAPALIGLACMRRTWSAHAGLAAAFLTAFAAWSVMFSIERYLMAAWMVAPILLAALVFQRWPGLASAPRTPLVLTAFACATVLATQPSPLRRTPWQSLTEPYAWAAIEGDLPGRGALVLFSGEYPTAFTAPLLAESTLGHTNTMPWSTSALATWRKARLDPLILDPNGPGLWTVIYDEGGQAQDVLDDIATFHPVRGRQEDCRAMQTSFDGAGQAWRLCPLSRAADLLDPAK